MINLIPTETRTNMMYARHNSAMLKWSFALAAGLIGVGLIVVAGMIYLTQTTQNQEKKLAIAEQNLNSQNITETEKKIDEISSNVKLTTQVLSREILFSKLLRQLGSALPANTSLQELQIDKFQGGLSLTALAKDINSATQVQVNLQDPKNKIFEKSDIENITCTPGNSDTNYPCKVQVRSLFLKNNPYLYIAPVSAEAKP